MRAAKRILEFLRSHPKVLIAGGVVAVAVGMGLLLWSLWLAPQPGSTGSPPVTYSTLTPDEQKIDESKYSWQGAVDEPKYISLPSIGASGFIQNVGVDQNQQIAVTTNIYLSGWFTESAKP